MHGGATAQRDFFINRTEKQAGKVRITEKAIERLESSGIEKPWEAWDLRFEIATAGRAGAVVAQLRDAVVRRGDFTLGPVDLDVGWGERIAILGPNGSGKTTLLNALLGRCELDAGTAQLGPSTVIGEIGQSRSAFATAAPLDRHVFVGRGRVSGRSPRVAREVRPHRRSGAAPGLLALAGRADPRRARAPPSSRRELPRARRADEPLGPAGDRATRVRPRSLPGHGAPRHSRPPAARRGAYRAGRPAQRRTDRPVTCPISGGLLGDPGLHPADPFIVRGPAECAADSRPGGFGRQHRRPGCRLQSAVGAG